MESTSLLTVEFAGSPTERGKQYGLAAGDLIRGSLAHYRAAMGEATGLTWEGVLDRSAAWVQPCRAFAPDLFAEIEGIAEGAGVDVLDILTLNARGEILYDSTFAQHTTAGESAEQILEGCSSFSLTAGAAGDGHVYAGQNWDWLDAVADTTMLVRVVQPPRPTVVMHVEAGQIGRQGANSAGLALNANGLGGRFDASVGIPQTFIRRRVLDSGGLLEAMRVLLRTQQHIASNALVTCREGFSVDLETTPGAHGWMYPDEGVLVHGNHYQSGVPAQLASWYRPSPDSLYRVPRIQSALQAARGASDTAEVRRIIHESMSDHLGFPKSVCAHPEDDVADHDRVSTLLSSLVDLTSGEYLVTAGQPCQRPYERVPWNVFDGPGATEPSPQPQLENR